MAGEPELFYIATLLSTTTVTGGVSITTSEDITDSWYATQALATAAAVAAGVLFHANNGAVAIPNGWEKGWIRNRDDGTWRQLAVSDLTNSASARLQREPCTSALLAWEAGVRDVEHEKPIIDVHRALDFLCFGPLGKLRCVHERERTPGRRRNRSRGLTR